MVVQKTESGEVNWIIETKGRVWEGTEVKDQALKTWCERISAVTGAAWRWWVALSRAVAVPARGRRGLI